MRRRGKPVQKITGNKETASTDWQHELACAYTDPRELLDALELEHLARLLPTSVTNDFALRVPRGFVARMRPGDADDPLLRQILPTASEAEPAAGYSADPVGDLAAHSGNGVLQKYARRALVVTTGACAVNCRYCFRRAYPYPDAALSGSGLRQLGAQLRAHSALDEIILSGGDPLTLSDTKLARLLETAESSRVRRLRIHTRVPIVLPERVTEALLAVLAAVDRPLTIVLHVNHPNEIDTAVREAARLLRPHCTALLNQSVLLRGVNDDAEVLAKLSEGLFDCGILPYYLHQLDRVSGAAHFEVSDVRAQRLVGKMAARLPGYLVPRLVREQAGHEAKTIMLPRSSI